MILDEFFDRIVILSLPKCGDRAERALRELREKGLSETAVVVKAVDGNLCRPTDWWPSGTGAWGCMQSHYRAVQDALMDGIEKLLVIEDDCIWQKDAGRLAADFLGQVPEDWGQIYFGGQHRGSHRPVWMEGKPAVLRAKSVHRTHCYGIHRKWMAMMLQHILYAPDYINANKGPSKHARHVDHQLEEAHRRGDWPVYCPSWWLAGQGENRSTINGRQQPDQWWHLSWHEGHHKLPVVVTSGPLSAEQARWLHFGAKKHRDEVDPTIDVGVQGASDADDLERIMRQIAHEALGMQCLPAMHAWPEKVEWIRERWEGPVVELKSGEEGAESGEIDLEGLCDFAGKKYFRHRWLNPHVEIAKSEEQEAESVSEAEPPWLHHVWLGGGELDPRLQGYMETVVAALPGYRHQVWKDEDLTELAKGAVLPDLMLDESLNIGLRADIVRLEVLRRHGGIYFDCDFEALRKDLRPLFAERPGAFVYADERSGRPSNAFMAAPAGHPFLEFYLQRIGSGLKPITDPWQVIGLSGPERLAECLNLWVMDWKINEPMEIEGERIGSYYGRGSIAGIWRETMYPYNWDQGTWATFDRNNYPKAWAAHHWEGGWNRQEPG